MPRRSKSPHKAWVEACRDEAILAQDEHLEHTTTEACKLAMTPASRFAAGESMRDLVPKLRQWSGLVKKAFFEHKFPGADGEPDASWLQQFIARAPATAAGRQLQLEGLPEKEASRAIGKYLKRICQQNRDDKDTNHKRCKLGSRKAMPRWGQKPAPATSPAIIVEEPQFDFIVEHRTNVVNGSILYRVRWSGFRPTADTWEPASNLPPNAIETYLINKAPATVSTRVDLRTAGEATTVRNVPALPAKSCPTPQAWQQGASRCKPQTLLSLVKTGAAFVASPQGALLLKTLSNHTSRCAAKRQRRSRLKLRGA